MIKILQDLCVLQANVIIVEMTRRKQKLLRFETPTDWSLIEEFNFAVLLLAFFFSASQANAIGEMPPWIWAPEQARISTDIHYFYSKANFNREGGTFTKLPADGFIQAYEYTPQVRYNFSRTYSIFSKVEASQVETLDGKLKRANSSVNRISAGFGARLLNRGVRILGEIEYGQGLKSFTSTTADALTYDGASFARTELFFYKPLAKHFVFGHAGARYRTEGLSSLGLFGAGFEFKLMSDLGFGIGVDGEQTLQSDTQTSSERNAILTRVQAGSQYYRSYNPSYIDVRTWLSYNIPPNWETQLLIAQRVNGREAAAGLSILLNVAFQFGFQDTSHRGEIIRTPGKSFQRRRTPTEPKFESEMETPDPDLFEEAK